MELSDRIEAVETTITKWKKVRGLALKLNNAVCDPCGFCKFYLCGPESCPATKICRENSDEWIDSGNAILKRIDENLKWLKKHRRNLGDVV